MRIIIPFLLAFSLVQASEIDSKLIKQLSDDDFAVREKATNELSKLPIDSVEQLAKLASQSEDPEAQTRLVKIRRRVIYNYLYDHDLNVLSMRIDVGAQFRVMNLVIDENKMEALFIYAVQKDGPADKQFQEGDFILAIDGKKPSEAVLDGSDPKRVYKIEILHRKTKLDDLTVRAMDTVRSEDGLAVKGDDYEKKTIEMQLKFGDCREESGIKYALDKAYEAFKPK